MAMSFGALQSKHKKSLFVLDIKKSLDLYKLFKNIIKKFKNIAKKKNSKEKIWYFCYIYEWWIKDFNFHTYFLTNNFFYLTVNVVEIFNFISLYEQ